MKFPHSLFRVLLEGVKGHVIHIPSIFNFFLIVDINSFLSLYTQFEILAEGNLTSFFDNVFFLPCSFHYMNDILMPHMLWQSPSLVSLMPCAEGHT